MKIQIPEKIGPVFNGAARYRGAYGGRGSAKSRTFATMALIAGMNDPGRMLCAREMQNSLRESVHAEMCQLVSNNPLFNACYEYGVDYLIGRPGTPAAGSDFIYRGIKGNTQNIRSLANIKRCWVEEAEYISESSWRVLLPTVFRTSGSEVWATWNPERVDSPTRKRLLLDPAESTKVVEVNWRDNPWFSKEMNDERLTDKRRDYDAYLHIWEGFCSTRSDAQVLRGKWVVNDFTPGPGWNGPYYGADWGFSVDPTVLVKLWEYKNVLYVEYEAYGKHTELNDIPRLFDTIQDSRKHKIYADSARPETISHLKHHGFIIEGAEKWSGSVEDGIEYLRGGFDKIVVHSRCVQTANEMQLYSHKIDRLTGEILPDIVDKWNHCIDAMRYAIGKMIKRRRSFFGV